MAEKVVFALFVQITALSLIVTPTSAALAEVDVGAAPQPRFNIRSAKLKLRSPMTTFARFWLPRECRTYSRTFAHRSSRHLNFRQRTYKSMYLQNYPTILKQSTGLSG